MSGLNPKWIVGKTIASVDMCPFLARPDSSRELAHDPIVTFTDGSRITFSTQETEVGVYGTSIDYRPASRARDKG